MNKKGFTNIILVIIIVVLVGLVGYFTLVRKPETSPITSMPPSASEETDWKIYTNRKYGYSIRYPSSWYINTSQSDTDLEPMSGWGQPLAYYVGGHTEWSNYKEIPECGDCALPEDLYILYLNIHRPRPTDTIDQFIENKEFTTPWEEVKKREELQINGIDAVRLLTIDRENPTEGYRRSYTILKTEDKVFIFLYYDTARRSLASEAEIIMRNIINSFRLLNQ